MKNEGILFLLTYALLCYSCNANNQQIKKIEKNIHKSNIIETIPVLANRQTEIIDNNLANNPLKGFSPYNKNLAEYFSGKYSISNSTIKNKFIDTIDTLIYYKKGRSFVKFYKAPDKILLDSLVVLDANFITLGNGFEIGMSKQTFLKHYKVNPNEYADSIAVVSDEGNACISFIFSNNKLIKISSFGYFD